MAAVFNIADRTVTGVKLASLGHIFQGMLVLVVFWICGKSLTRAIDESLEQQEKRVENDCRASTEKEKLVTAKKKTGKKLLGFVLQQVIMNSIVNSFAVFSEYGTAAPLLLFGLPMALVSHALSLLPCTGSFLHRSP